MLKYGLLLNELEQMIKSHPYKEGDKLPSIRSLSEQYGYSKSTVIKAIGELEKRHQIYSVPKSGYYVVKRTLSEHTEEPALTDFAGASPDSEIFPYIDFQHCINKAIDTYKNDLFVYGTSKGLPSLIQVIQKQLANYQVFTSLSRLFIVSGVQQALSILTSLPFPNRKQTVLIEQPSYHLFIEHLTTHQIPVIGIKRTAQGIDLQELEQLFRTADIKFFYTMPRFQNPLGCSYSKEDKLAIVELARKYDVYIVEDDFLADFELDSKVDPLFAYDTTDHVIYLKSYSKIIFPGLRIGVAVIPEVLSDLFNRYKRLLDIDSSMLSQGALEIYLKSGMFERHKQYISSSYEQRARLLADSLQRYSDLYPDLFTFNRTKQPCFHTHVVLNSSVSVSKLAAKLKPHSIIIEAIDKNYLPHYPKAPILRLNVSNVKDSAIEQAIGTIVECLRTLR
ncbi:DNA-binding transcriptional regulator, MocR family, contains an aminotransferase domain [Paenibacillus sp. 1_12]|uniref:aminotransferase-like domain-containing protein n=1 Tax=Paenibacillus sp. 1_12 TaxID=1566278 RepID=UPI0008F26F19|nr:PLP-dependent aminotransferase family protein [Paenibacillus sp. 1_12]SFM06602.1 DNA-binding transcriptional regulator, MocR family, contains an aminotransferase domain [Paenibacillus sp. 1_12]